MFFKFINKCQTEILRFAHCLHMCMIFLKYTLRWLKLEIQFPPLNIFWENIYQHGWMMQTILASVTHFSHTLACSLSFSSVYYKTQPVLCFCNFYNMLWFLEFYLEYIWIIQNKCMSFLASIASGNTPQLLRPSKRKHSFSLPFRVSFSGGTLRLLQLFFWNSLSKQMSHQRALPPKDELPSFKNEAPFQKMIRRTASILLIKKQQIRG